MKENLRFNWWMYINGKNSKNIKTDYNKWNFNVDALSVEFDIDDGELALLTWE